jgi:hypothetical protein
MNKKILGILAASAALGSAMIAAPAQAVMEEVNLSVDVQKAIYLKTFADVNLKISPEDFSETLQQSEAVGTTDGSATLDPYIGPIPAGSGTGAGTVSKTVAELFAVSANTNTPVEVKITGPAVGVTTGTLSKSPASTNEGLADSIQLAGITATNVTGGTGTVAGNIINGTATPGTPFKGGVTLDFNVPSSAQGGIYQGKLYVEAIAK